MLILWQQSLAARHALRGQGVARVLYPIGLVLWLGLAGPVWGAPQLTAALDRDTISAGESATLSLVFEGASPEAPPNVPLPASIRVQFSGRSSQVNIVNGQASSSLTYSYILTPTQAGDFVVPSFSFHLGNQTFASNPLKLKVLPPGTPADPGASNAPKLAFLKLLVPKEEIYVGEVLPVEGQLYFLNAQNIQPMLLPADGFISGKNAPPGQTTAQIGNQVYNVIIFKTSVVPTKAGDLALGPAECDLTLVIPRASNRRRDPFEDPFGFFGPRADLRPVKLTSEAKKLRVLPLPAQNVPEKFNGAVGNYTMEVSASPTNIAVGDPITIKVRLAGRGSLDTLNLPSFDDWQNFKTYPPSTKVDTSDPLGIEGVKTFEFVATPQAADLQALPPVVFSYFDPGQKGYRQLTHEAVRLTIRPVASTVAPPGGVADSGNANPSAPQDIANIKPRLGTLVLAQPPLAARPWFIGLQAIPILAFLAAWLWRKHEEKLDRNPLLRRQSATDRRVAQGLRELKPQAEAQDYDGFHANAFRLLQEKIGERLNLPASAITEAVIDEQLRPLGVTGDTLALLREIFHACNQARYAPMQPGEDLARQYAKVVQALGALKDIKRP